MADIFSQVSCITPCIFYLCVTWFTPAVLNSSPRALPPPAYFACLSLLTHLIRKISSLEVLSVHELCSDWHARYTQCPLLPTPGAGEIRCSLLHFGTFIHSLRCATASSTDECDIIYFWYIQFKFTSHTLICSLNGIENRWFTHSVSSPGRAYQVVHKTQMSAFEVVAEYF